MTRDELASHLDTLFASDAWHWFTWHFRAGGRAGVHPFAADVIDALMAIDAKSQGSRSGWLVTYRHFAA